MQGCRSPPLLTFRHNNVQYYYLAEHQNFVKVPDVPADFDQQLRGSLIELAAIKQGTGLRPLTRALWTKCCMTH